MWSAFVFISTVVIQITHSRQTTDSDPEFYDKQQNPCPSAEKDALLGIDRGRDAADRILLIGYVAGAAYPINHSVPAINYNRAGSMISGSLTYAVHLINTLRDRFNASERQRRNLPEPPLPPGYKLDFCYLETFGTESASIRAVTRLVERVRVSAILGPQETCRVEAAIATTYNRPMISHYCDDHSLRGNLFGRSRPVFLRTRPQPYDIASAVLALLKQFNWLKVAYLTTEDPELGFTAEVLRNTLVSHHVEIRYTNTFRFPQLCGLSTNEFTDIVEQSFRNVRIYLVVGEVYDSVCLLEALRTLNLLKNGDYFVIGIDKRTYDPSALYMWTQSSWPLDLARKLHTGELPRQSCLHMNPECFRAYMQVTHRAPSSERCAQLQEYNQCYLTKAPFNFKLSSSNFNLELEAGYLVDSVWLYALAAGEILAAGGTVEDAANGDLIASKLINRRYESSLGYVNEINERGDAQGNYTVIMAVSESKFPSFAPSECGAVEAYHRSPEWYDQHTPLLPEQCRRMRWDRTNYPADSRNSTLNQAGNMEDTGAIWPAMNSFDVPFALQPIGMFYPLSGNNERQGEDNSAPSELESQRFASVNGDAFADTLEIGDSMGTGQIKSGQGSMPYYASYNFHASLPLLSELGKRMKQYSFAVVQGHQIDWISGHAPLDEPVCGFDGSRCKTADNNTLEVGLSVVATFVLVMTIGGVFVYRNRKFELELERLLWKVDSRDIVLRTTITKTSVSDSNDVSPSDCWTFARLNAAGADVRRKRSRWIGLLQPKLSVSDSIPEMKLSRDVDADLETASTRLLSNPYRLFPTATNRREQRRQLLQSIPASIQSGGSTGATGHKNCAKPTDSISSSMNANHDELNQSSTVFPTEQWQKQSRRQKLQAWFTWDSLIHRRPSDTSSSANLTSNPRPKSHGLALGETVDPTCFGPVPSWYPPWFGSATVSGYFKRQLVAVHRIHLCYAHINRDVKKSLKLLRDVSHKNLASFIGACVELDRVCVLWEYASRGSLRDILKPEHPRLKPMFVASLTFDIIRGLTYLHDSHLRYHGNLKSANCVVDSRWVLKLTDFGLNAFRSGEGFAHLTCDEYFSRLYWTPPELLRRMLALLLSRQLSELAHPQLAVVAETLMTQGVTFTLNNSAVETEFAEEEDHVKLHGISTAQLVPAPTGSTTPAFSGLNETSAGEATKFTADRKRSIRPQPCSKPPIAPNMSATVRHQLLLQAKVDLARPRSVPCTADQIEAGLTKPHCTESSKCLHKHHNLGTRLHSAHDDTSSQNPPVTIGVGDEAPRLSTILIHPGGASFMHVSQLDVIRNTAGTHTRVLRWSETSEPRLSRLFRSSKKVLYGGLFTVSHETRRKPSTRSRWRSLVSSRLRALILGTRRDSNHPEPVRTHNRPIALLAEHRHSSARTPVATRKRSRDSSLWERESDKHARTLPGIGATASTVPHSRQRIRLPEVRDPIGSMQMADIYAFGIVLFELHLQNDPYKESRHGPQEIIRRVIVLNDQFGVPYRPKLSLLSREEKYITDCIESCWTEEPLNRPSIKQIASRLRPMVSDQHTNIMDHMMSLMEEYAQELENLVAARTTELQQEKRLSEALLYQMLPIPVAEQLKRGKLVEPEAFDNVTIYFSDICGFTEWSSTASPFEVVNLLNELYTRFDSVLSSYDVYKVETIGDAYMVVSGLPQHNDNHAGEIASMSLRLLEEIQHKFTLALRIGIHSGPCAAGVVGTKMPRYCLFGDTVNTASRMEGSGAPWRIHCSEQCKRELDSLGEYVLEERGNISLKGKGTVRTYWLLHKTWPGREKFAQQPTHNQKIPRSSVGSHPAKEPCVVPGQENNTDLPLGFQVYNLSYQEESANGKRGTDKAELEPIHPCTDAEQFYPCEFNLAEEVPCTTMTVGSWPSQIENAYAYAASSLRTCGPVVLARQKRSGSTSVLTLQNSESTSAAVEQQRKRPFTNALSSERMDACGKLAVGRSDNDMWPVSCDNTTDRNAHHKIPFTIPQSNSSDRLGAVWQWNPTPSNPGTPRVSKEVTMG